MDRILRPTFAIINLYKLENNLKRIKDVINNRMLTFIVKANAYGHGLVEISKFVEKKKLCNFLGVSSIEEGITLRENGIKLPVLVLGSIYPFSNFKYLYRYKLTPTISSVEAMDEIINYSKRAGRKINVHLKLETGMNRIGASQISLLKMVEKAINCEFVNIEGIYSHLSSSDCDREYTLNQIKIYNETVNKIKGIKFIRHIANSYATFHYPDSHMDMVRCGIAGYGKDALTQILSLKTRIVFIKYVKKGSYISYSKSFKTNKKTKVATIPIGYGDGYLRSLSNRAEVLVNGKRAKVIGNITMDMCMLDVSNINCRVGDEVVLTGGSSNDFISLEEVAKRASTIVYEITTLITQRVRRIYIYEKDNENIG